METVTNGSDQALARGVSGKNYHYREHQEQLNAFTAKSTEACSVHISELGLGAYFTVHERL